MSTSPRRGGGLQAFRLGDIPEGIRLRAKDRLLKTEGSVDGMLVATSSPLDRLRIGMAAERPSPRVYWIPREAWERVMLPKNRRKP